MAANKKKKTSRRGRVSQKKRPAGNKKNILLRRLFIVFAAIIVLLWGGAWFFLSDADKNSSSWLKYKLVNILADAGFRVENILVEGRKHTDPDILLALINIEKGDPIFSFNPDGARSQIEKIGWVKSVRIERHLPSMIYISITERKPLALQQDKDGLSLIDIDGEVITNTDLDKFKDLLMVSGKGAAKNASQLINLLDSTPELKHKVDSAKFIDERRWNLYLTDGKLIKLPQDDIDLAIQNIMQHQNKNGILDSDSIKIIDARYKGRLIIRTKLGKVRDYKAMMEY